MKLVDEKGRFLGKINIFDCFVILLIIIAVAFVILKYTDNNIAQVDNSESDITITVKCRMAVEEAEDALKADDKLVAKGVYTNGRIVSVKAEQAEMVTTMPNGFLFTGYHPFYKDITVQIKDRTKADAVILHCAEQEARVGYKFIVKTQTVELEGVITNIKIGR